jgi:FHS family glucose/mannose:H+ symporter-like MFS transporter
LMIRFPKSTEIKGPPFKEGLKMAMDPLLLLFGFILFFQSGIEGLTNNWTTTYLETVKEIEASDALFILSSFVGAITVARIILGKVLRIFNPLKVMVVGFVIVYIGCLLLFYSSSFFMLMVGMVAIGMGLASGFPVILGYIGKIYTHLSGTAFSIAITIALLGNVIANYLMGQISQQLGVVVLPYFIVIAISTLLILLYITNKKYNIKIN